MHKSTQYIVPVTMPPNQDNNVFSVSSELAPTFREIMSASKIEKKASAHGDTWIRIVNS